MEKDIKVIFEGNEEIIKIIESGGSIVKHLGFPNETCPLIGKKIELTKKIGKGKYGTVFDISIPGMGTRKYVVKRGNIQLKLLEIHKNILLNIETPIGVSNAFVGSKKPTILNTNQLEDKYGYNWNEIKQFQSENIMKTIQKANLNDKVTVFLPSDICKLRGDQMYNKIPGKGRIIVPKGSYLCDDNSYSEFAIGAYTGRLYREGKCINFFDVYSMFTCPDPSSKNHSIYYQYIFMDKIDGILGNHTQCISLSKYINQIPKESRFDIANGIYIQVICAIAIYQQELMLSHNDLHQENIFLEYVKPETQFNGQYLYDADYYSYTINNRTIYFPATPVLAKIGDYGLSVKFSEPIIGDKRIFQDGINGNLPNIYLPQYDCLYFTAVYILIMMSDLLHGYKNEQVILASMIFLSNLKGEVTFNMVKKTYLDNNYRPVLDKIDTVKTANDIFLGPLLNLYSKKPLSGKIVNIGNI